MRVINKNKKEIHPKKIDVLILLLVYRRHINENTKNTDYTVCNKIGNKT